jgi:hypothetical protein
MAERASQGSMVCGAAVAEAAEELIKSAAAQIDAVNLLRFLNDINYSFSAALPRNTGRAKPLTFNSQRVSVISAISDKLWPGFNNLR